MSAMKTLAALLLLVAVAYPYQAQSSSYGVTNNTFSELTGAATSPTYSITGFSLTGGSGSVTPSANTSGTAASPKQASPAPTGGGSFSKTPLLSKEFNCSSGTLSVYAKYGDKPISDLTIKLFYTSELDHSSANTSSSGHAIFNITKDGNYSVESAQMNGFYPAFLDRFSLELCQAVPPAPQPENQTNETASPEEEKPKPLPPVSPPQEQKPLPKKLPKQPVAAPVPPQPSLMDQLLKGKIPPDLLVFFAAAVLIIGAAALFYLREKPKR